MNFKDVWVYKSQRSQETPAGMTSSEAVRVRVRVRVRVG